MSEVFNDDRQGSFIYYSFVLQLLFLNSVHLRFGTKIWDVFFTYHKN